MARVRAYRNRSSLPEIDNLAAAPAQNGFEHEQSRRFRAVSANPPPEITIVVFFMQKIFTWRVAVVKDSLFLTSA
jgi:hypothetical protein